MSLRKTPEPNSIEIDHKEKFHPKMNKILNLKHLKCPNSYVNVNNLEEGKNEITPRNNINSSVLYDFKDYL